VSLSKVEKGLAFHGIENRADICAAIIAMPKGGVTPEQVEAVDTFNTPGNGESPLLTFDYRERGSHLLSVTRLFDRLTV
jgi:hypothetical protein